MHIVSAAGTNLYCKLGEFPVISEYGFVDEPGRWDHWPSGFALTFPDEGGTNGILVVGFAGHHNDFTGWRYAQNILNAMETFIDTVFIGR